MAGATAGGCLFLLVFFWQGGPPPKTMHKSGLTTGKTAFMPSRSSPKVGLYRPNQGGNHCMSCTRGLS